MAVWLGVVLSLALSPQTVEIPAAAEPEPVAVEVAPAAPADPRAEAAAARAAHADRLSETMDRILAERAAEAEVEAAERARREAETKEGSAPFELRFEPPPLPDLGIDAEDAQGDGRAPGGLLGNPDNRRTLPRAERIATPEAEKTFAERYWTAKTRRAAGLTGGALALALALWWLWRRGFLRLAFERVVRPYWREGALFTLLGAILIKIW